MAIAGMGGTARRAEHHRLAEPREISRLQHRGRRSRCVHGELDHGGVEEILVHREAVWESRVRWPEHATVGRTLPSGRVRASPTGRRYPGWPERYRGGHGPGLAGDDRG